MVPLFSLCAVDPAGKTLLEELSLAAGKTPVEFTTEHLIKPFSQAWVESAVNRSLVAEDHAQNVMLELSGENKKPTGRFFLRDGGGFYINPKSPFIKKGELKKLPTFSNFEWDYQKFAGIAESRSLETYFTGGFLYNIDQELSRLDKKYKQGSIYKSFWKEIQSDLIKAANLKEHTFSMSELKHDMEGVLKKVRESKAMTSYQPLSHGLGRPLKIGFYTGTFDPPHQGHLDLIENAKKQLGLDIIYVSPNTDVSHKENILSYKHRKEMTKLGLYQDGVVIANEELESALKSKGVDKAIEKLMSKYDMDTKYFRIMGDDSFSYYLNNPKAKTFKNLTFVTSQRLTLSNNKIAIPNKIGLSQVIEIQGSDKGYSSTALKKLINEGKKPHQINEKVWKYIEKNQLYGFLPQKNNCLDFLFRHLHAR